MKATAGRELSFDDAMALALARPTLRLIAIDGLPVSGKSTLADRMADALGADCLYLDDFVKPEGLWPSRPSPSFPFAYIRYGEFLDAVKSLAQHGRCSYRPYDWAARQVKDDARTITLGKPVIVEGVSALRASGSRARRLALGRQILPPGVAWPAANRLHSRNDSRAFWQLDLRHGKNQV